jgi:uncharacterized protein (TIGR03032 family)
MASLPETPVLTGTEREDALAVPTPHSVPGEEQRLVRCAYSENLPSLLGQLNGSLLLSTYLTGNLVTVAAGAEKLDLSFHTFDRPMGMAVKREGIAIGTRTQVWFLHSAPDIAAKLQPRGRYDSAYLTRHSHFTGNIQCHETAWGGNELWIVNTLFSCLSTLHPSYSFAPRWRPRFITALAAEDRCHLNGLAMADGQPRYVSALAEADNPQGWRSLKTTSGCLIDVVSGETIVRALTMPHSPRVAGKQLYVLHSGLGRLETVDPTSGQRTTVCELPGYTRGLAICGS